jgi:hypothetical protein
MVMSGESMQTVMALGGMEADSDIAEVRATGTGSREDGGLAYGPILCSGHRNDGSEQTRWKPPHVTP